MDFIQKSNEYSKKENSFIESFMDPNFNETIKICDSSDSRWDPFIRDLLSWLRSFVNDEDEELHVESPYDPYDFDGETYADANSYFRGVGNERIMDIWYGYGVPISVVFTLQDNNLTLKEIKGRMLDFDGKESEDYFSEDSGFAYFLESQNIL